MRTLVLALLWLSWPAAAGDLYDCAKELSLLHANIRALGPIFYRENLAFTSTDIKGRLFIVITPDQILIAPLEQTVINRLTFKLNGSTYYVSYMHGEITGNRYFDFSRNMVPAGRQKEDFKPVDLHSAPWVTAALISVMDEQMDSILSAIRTGVVDKAKANYFTLNSCQKIQGDVHAAQLRHNVDVLHLWTRTQPRQPAVSRLPASL